ncbi:MBL fold metallo-hydrolase [Pontibacter sp. 172403-2]|uniref:MBL fold metallo-hydrolase n=1 Tax=Pontibacter rufus TaxID=2791028 RepID=UPI0018AF8E45|nr:MBL fold metallo-hydrolase [Pontibacter sp. 172403-2]MBF9252188.1 MBL fold metallo-hydrolase [Pontibacter sp. 172403-2]
MHIKRFYDEGLAHASYAVLSDKQVALVDPGRDPQSYYDFAEKHGAKIVAVVETHLHADFVSGHLEIHSATNAPVYISRRAEVTYPHTAFDEGDQVTVGKLKLVALNTPGHSSDSISVLVKDEQGKEHAVFTGDTLFVGDVGRPDLREDATSSGTRREELARQLYHSTRELLMQLDKDVKVYPAHGAGSLCGKNISSNLSSTIGQEVEHNYALQPMPEDTFVQALLEEQPYIPKYFSYDVALNRKGTEAFGKSVEAVPRLNKYASLQRGVLLVDTRPQEQFKAGHLPGAISIMCGKKFETWLGSVVGPQEEFYLLADSHEALEGLIRKAAKIGYEKNIRGALQAPTYGQQRSLHIDLQEFMEHSQDFTIVDLRNESEVKERKIFDQALHIPLPELRDRTDEIGTDKPVVVHCASGYRSAIGASILEKSLAGTPVYDLGKAIKDFEQPAAKAAK